MSYASMTMTGPQIDTFLGQVRSAVLATNRRDGAPQLSTVWYVYDQGLIYIGFEGNSAKHRNIRQDRRVSLCVGGEHPDSRTITIYGVAEFIEKSDPRFDGANRLIGERYGGTGEQRETGESAVERMLIAIKPEKILATDFN